jgi:hypothetical protein
VLLGIWLATAGFNMYTVYDFVTFGETLDMINRQFSEESIEHFKNTDFDFALQGDAKLSMVIFTACILAIFVSYFYSFTIYQGM